MSEAIKNGEWVRKIIASCENSFHLDVATTLIDLYVQRHGEHNEMYSELLSEKLKAKAKILIP